LFKVHDIPFRPLQIANSRPTRLSMASSQNPKTSTLVFSQNAQSILASPSLNLANLVKAGANTNANTANTESSSSLVTTTTAATANRSLLLL
jgi:hypothetical protein